VWGGVGVGFVQAYLDSERGFGNIVQRRGMRPQVWSARVSSTVDKGDVRGGGGLLGPVGAGRLQGGCAGRVRGGGGGGGGGLWRWRRQWT
jgi:hypothetical protein